MIVPSTSHPKGIGIALVVLLLSASQVGALEELVIQTKQVCAPASDLVSGQLRLPTPADTATVSNHVLLSADSPVWQRAFDATGAFSIALIQPTATAVSMELHDVNQRRTYSLSSTTAEVQATHTSTAIPFLADELWATRYDVANLNGHAWQAQVTGVETSTSVLCAKFDSDWMLRSALASHETVVGRTGGLRASLRIGATQDALPLPTTNLSATLHWWRDGVIERSQTWSGNQPEIQFDWIWQDAGPVVLHLFVEATLEDGTTVLRSTEQLAQVIDRSVAVTGATSNVAANGNLGIDLALANGDGLGRVLIAGELWGTNLRHELQPVCFFSRMENSPSEPVRAQFDFDSRWFAQTGLGAPFELRKLRIQDAATMIPFERVPRLELPTTGSLPPQPPNSQILTSASMLQGSPGTSLKVDIDSMESSFSALGGHALTLVHGYCANGNPYPTSHFSGALAEFSDPNQVRSNDEFALLIAAFGMDQKSYGIVAHSQGGLASLHLFTYYRSGLDWARGDRRIQSVGSPYQGTPLAGDLALIGEIFGAGCGENFDLTYAGAALWLAGIPTWAREEVWYWTTSFTDEIFVFDYCNIVTDLFLSDPEDGVVEQSNGQLPGANNMGHKEGWCHTDGMRDPAQTQDSGRNAEMDLRARR